REQVYRIPREEFPYLGLGPVSLAVGREDFVRELIRFLDHLDRGLDAHPSDIAIELGQPACIRLVILQCIAEATRGRLSEVGVELLPALHFLRQPLPLGLAALCEPGGNDGQDSADHGPEQRGKGGVHSADTRLDRKGPHRPKLQRATLSFHQASSSRWLWGYSAVACCLASHCSSHLIV